MDASQPVRVWAPIVDGLDLVLGDGTEDEALTPAGGGFFDGPRLTAGTRYRLRVHGGPGDGRTITDPAAHSLPDGVFGPGEAIYHSFRWTDGRWRGGAGADRRRASIYEMHVGTFTSEGTFAAAAGRLGHLVDLGVTHVELLPCASFMGRHGWGYDGVMWWAPHHAYGGVAAMKGFVDAAHGAGLAVLLDVVYNHLGPEGDTTWALWPIKNPLHQTPWGDAINLDGEHGDGVKRLILDNALGWLRHYHLDGLRLDAVHALVDRSPVHLLQQLSEEVDTLALELGRPPVVDRRVRVPQPRPGAAPGEGWARAARLLGRRPPPHHPHRAHRRVGRLLRPLRQPPPGGLGAGRPVRRPIPRHGR